MKELKVNRRDFLRLSGIATVGVLAAACGTAPIPEASTGGSTPAAGAAAAATTAPAAAGKVAEVARNKSLIMIFGGDGTQFTDTGLGSPYTTGYTHQMGNSTIYSRWSTILLLPTRIPRGLPPIPSTMTTSPS